MLKRYNISAIFFDIDGTLYRQRPVQLQMTKELLFFAFKNPIQGPKVIKTISLFRANREKLRRVSTSNVLLEQKQFRDVAQRIGMDERQVKEYTRHWMFERPLKYLPRYKIKGIEEFLSWLQRKGLAIGTLSDYEGEEKLRALGIAHFFHLNLCTTAPEINALKPSPRGLYVAAELLNIKPHQILYIGDRPSIDGIAAKRAGAHFGLIGKRDTGVELWARDFLEFKAKLGG
jgi:HAD superfamily hydrolase (TIGR01549 family)